MSAQDVDSIVARIDEVHRPGSRTLVAIAGAPGSGKSTLAQRLVAALTARDGSAGAALVSMDGYHLDNEELDALGLRAIKGAPQTFDAAGFVALVRQIRANVGHVSYPLFDRGMDRTIPEAGKLDAGCHIVVFEGNYLLLQDGVWAGLQGLFDVTVMLSVPMSELRARLVDRWLSHGLSKPAAEARAQGNDIPNARLVIANSATADLTLGAGTGANA